MILASIVRLHGLGHDSLWFDESTTLMTAAGPFSQIPASVDRLENMPPFYFYFINPWNHLVGYSDFRLRLPSALFGIAGVAVMFLVGRRIAPPKYADAFGLVAALLLAISRYHIAYSQQARAYTLMFLLCLISCHAFLRLIQDGFSSSVAIIFVLSSAAMLWTQPFTGFSLLAQNAFYFAIRFVPHWPRPRLSLRQWLKFQGLVALLFGPWIKHMMLVMQIGSPWMNTPHFKEAADTYTGTAPLLICLLILAAMDIFRGIRQRDKNVLLALLLCAFPVAIPILASTAKHPLFIPRYGFSSLIGLYLVAAGGALALGRFAWMAVMAFVIMALPNLAHDFRTGTTAEYRAGIRDAAQFIMQSASPGDGAYCLGGYEGRSFDVYVQQAPWARHDLQYLSDLPSPPAAMPHRVWLILDPDAAKPRIDVPSPYQVIAIRNFHGVAVAELLTHS